MLTYSITIHNVETDLFKNLSVWRLSQTAVDNDDEEYIYTISEIAKFGRSL